MSAQEKGPWLVSAYQLDGKGGGTPLSAKDLAPGPPKGLFWIHLDATKDETRKWLKAKAKLDPVTVSALLEEETRPRVTEMEGGTLVILRGVNLNENAEPEDMVSIRLFVTEGRVYSARRRRLKAVGDLEDALKAGTGPAGMGELVVRIVHLLVDRMQPTFTALEDMIDSIEEEMEEKTGAELRAALMELRREVVRYRRYLLPQRDALGRLRMSAPPWLGRDQLISLQEAYDRTVRILEELDAGRERIQIIQDQITTQLANELNQKMYLLSIMAALFLPLGFLTGLLGINVAGIPGAEYGQAFWVFVGLLAVIVVFMVLFFRKKGWL